MISRAAVLFALLALAACSPDPNYKGRPLSAWCADLNDSDDATVTSALLAIANIPSGQAARARAPLEAILRDPGRAADIKENAALVLTAQFKAAPSFDVPNALASYLDFHLPQDVENPRALALHLLRQRALTSPAASKQTIADLPGIDLSKADTASLTALLNILGPAAQPAADALAEKANNSVLSDMIRASPAVKL